MSKIDGFGQKPPQVNGGKRGGTVERADADPKSAGGQSAARGDTVTLTESARQLQRLEDAVAASPVTDSQRVQALKETIARGEYQVNAERVADKIIQSERELTGR
jgi:negative regulator of flagellin synthesis FlgM